MLISVCFAFLPGHGLQTFHFAAAGITIDGSETVCVQGPCVPNALSLHINGPLDKIRGDWAAAWEKIKHFI